MSTEIYLGIDAGGTFTDFIAIARSPDLKVTVHKILSTPEAPEQAILQGIAAMGLDKLKEGDRLHIIHGSTVATNAVLEGNLARTAFVTNHGLGDLLSLGRQTRPSLYALHFPEQRPPVPAELCLETGGRLGADGTEVEPLTASELQGLVQQLKDLEPEAVAVNLLFSFLDDRFEVAITEAIEAAGLDLFVSCSSRVLPVYREYERGIATWLNAALGPVISGYLGRLLEQLGKRVPLQIMQSNGETVAAGQAADAAVHLLLSGPAGGLMAMHYLGQQTGSDHIISFDMGGTSTDVALISGAPQITSEGSVGSYPVAVPMVDMHTIGAGGGSVAFVDDGGMLQVGPRSAGANPGPACYGKGGSEATVTDANLVLGRLLADAPLAGGLRLDEEQARAAIAGLARQIDMSVEETALGVVRIANEHMARAIRMISVNRGHDPQQYLLASFGGAGGLHVCDIADIMHMRRALVPVHGGVLSALGMLVADQGRQHTRTVNTSLQDRHGADLRAAFVDLEAIGRQELLAGGLDADALQIRQSADLRYQGQSYTLNVPWESVAEAEAAFVDSHRQRYGYVLSADIEVVNLRVNVFSPQQELTLPAAQTEPCKKPRRVKVYGHSGDVQVYDRQTLETDTTLPGPAIITEYTATTFVAPGWKFRRDRLGNLLLEKPT